jgi:predicted Zn-dependent protease
MQNREAIDSLLKTGKVEEAIHLLNLEIAKNNQDDELYYLRGNAYYKINNWKEALENYLEAVSLNADSPAKEAIKMAQNILNFYNKDIYCQ